MIVALRERKREKQINWRITGGFEFFAALDIPHSVDQTTLCNPVDHTEGQIGLGT
jgi:hypothetical protein